MKKSCSLAGIFCFAISISAASQESQAAPTPLIQPDCTSRHTFEGSEACAAWLSADAARDAVFWSQVQAGIAFAGVLGLLATLYFALQANRTARRSNEDQLRAWTKLTPHVSGNLIRHNDGCSLSVKIELENIGATPAINVQLFARLYSKGDVGLEVERFAEAISDGHGAEYPCTLFPGERVSRVLQLNDNAGGVGEQVDSLMLSLIVGAKYRTVFDRPSSPRRLTIRVYDLSNDGSGLIQVNRGAGPATLLLTTNILMPGLVT